MEDSKEQLLYLNEFLKHINSIKNLFDLMALCINYILKEIGEQEFDIIHVLNSPNNKYSEIVNLLNNTSLQILGMMIKTKNLLF